MKRIWLAGALGTATLLSACGGGNQETPPSDTPSAGDTAALPAEATPGADNSALPSATPGTVAAEAASSTLAPAASTAPAMASAATPPEAFKPCGICHSAQAGTNGIGPSLAGIYGTKAGEVPGYDFSDAMKNSGLTWNAATLDRFLTTPQDVVPGTKMSFGGLKDADKRTAVIAYLKSL